MPAHIRPTQNLVRKAIFDIIGHDLGGLSFLDLFAGSGAVGLEALSCGAAEVYLVEHDPKCVEVIEDNLQLLDPAQRGISAYLLKQDSFFTIKEFARQGKKFDIVFFDPPYGLKLAKKTLKTIMSHDILHPSSFIVAQCDEDEKLPEVDESIIVIKDKVYGSSRLTVYENSGRGAEAAEDRSKAGGQ